MNSSFRLLQLTSVAPPIPDGIGDAAARLNAIIRARGGWSAIATSEDQHAQEGVFPCVRSWSGLAFYSLWRLVRENHVSMILMHYPSPKYKRSISIVVLPILFRALGCAFIIYAHEYVSYTYLGKLRLTMMLLPATKVLTSDSQNMRAIGNLPFVRKKCSVFLLGSTIPNAGLLRSCRDLASVHVFRVLHFGLIQKGKGLEALLEALTSHPDLKGKTELHIVGGLAVNPKSEEVHLYERIKSLPFVVDHGFVSANQLEEVFSSIDLFALPYEDGATERRSSLMAALAYGLPVLTTMPRLPISGLHHGENVWFVPSASAKSVGDGLIELRQMKPEHRQQLGVKGKEWYEEHFSEDAIFARIERLYRMT